MIHRKQAPPTLKRYCLACGSPFVARRKTALYCQPKCRVAACRATKTVKVTKTKPKELELVVIHCCGCSATWWGNRNTQKLYHSVGCKQKAWRARKALGIDYLGRKVKR